MNTKDEGFKEITPEELEKLPPEIQARVAKMIEELIKKTAKLPKSKKAKESLRRLKKGL